jgi:hypothetical protein
MLRPDPGADDRHADHADALRHGLRPQRQFHHLEAMGLRHRRFGPVPDIRDDPPK